MAAPDVATAADLYRWLMLGPRANVGVCSRCFNLTDGYGLCYACTQVEPWLDHMIPISYSVGAEPLHRVLAAYKRLGGERARRLQIELAVVIQRFLERHEPCICAATGVHRFDVVATVPSSDARRDEAHPLRMVVSQLVPAARRRHERLLRRSQVAVPAREFDRRKYRVTRPMAGEAVLLIDDTWTSGASAQSAAAALKLANAGRVACLVIGRHLNREWHQNDQRLEGLAPRFEWERCADCR